MLHPNFIQKSMVVSGLLLTLSACATSDSNTEPNLAKLESGDNSAILQTGSTRSPNATPQPQSQPQDSPETRCELLFSENLTEELGYTIKRIELKTRDSNLELTVFRTYSEGIPPTPSTFVSSKSRLLDYEVYGEWEESEHWLHIKKYTDNWRGTFTWMAEFPVETVCTSL